MTEVSSLVLEKMQWLHFALPNEAHACAIKIEEIRIQNTYSKDP